MYLIDSNSYLSRKISMQVLQTVLRTSPVVLKENLSKMSKRVLF